jgi:UDP-N-acetyl-D-mannosaminuronate dehydrogenase
MITECSRDEVKAKKGCSKLMMQFNKVLVIGLGQLGLPVAKYMKERGFDTYGYDISPKAVEIAEKTAAVKRSC